MRNVTVYSAGRWPKLCQPDNHLSAQHTDSSYSQISQGGPVVFLNGFHPGTNQGEVTVFLLFFVVFWVKGCKVKFMKKS